MNIVVAFSPVNYKDERRRKAQEVAIRVLSRSPSFVYPVAFDFLKDSSPFSVVEECNIPTLNILKRDSSKTISNTRRLPYIKEILELCSKIDCDIFGYINSDILVDENVYQNLFEDKDAFIFSRSDIAEVSVEDFLSGKSKVIYGGDKHIGADGFFFKKEWWLNNRQKFPDNLIIGSTEWDTCYRHIIKKLTTNFVESRSLYHVYHNQTWTTTSPSALNNIAIWNEIKNKGLY